jgi:hypothetical protein
MMIQLCCIWGITIEGYRNSCNCWIMGSYILYIFVYGLWPTRHLFFCVAIILVYDVNVVKP